MTSLIQNRLIWKDYREFMLPLFVAGCLAFVLTIAATCFSWLGTEEIKSLGLIGKLISPLNMFANSCGLVLGVLLFAPEKENRTSQFLASLPAAPRSLAMTKLGFGIAGLFFFVAFCYLTVAITGVLFGSALSGWPPTSELIANLFIPLICFICGVFWSLMLRSTLFALPAAAATVLFMEFLANYLVPEALGQTRSPSAISYLAWALRIPVSALLVGLIVRALPGWLQDQTTKSTFPWVKGERVLARIGQSDARKGVMSSLLWQSFRQSRVVLFVCAIACGLIAAVSLSFVLPPQLFFILLMIAFCVPLFASSLAFAGDHIQNRYRFFQQQAEFGKQLWRARLLPSAALAGLTTICLMFGFDAVSVLQLSNYYSLVDHYGYFVGEFNLPYLDGVLLHLTTMKVLIIFLTAVAIGQFFSMMNSSPILAVVSAGLYGIVGLAWAFLLMVCDASLVLFLLPVAVILLLTTWVMAPRWLADRKTVFERYYPWLSLLLAAVLVIGGFAVKRSTEVPRLPTRPSGVPRGINTPGWMLSSTSLMWA